MRFAKHLSKEVCELLEDQYKEYIKKTPMSKKEQRALRSWVQAGYSVYENPYNAWADGGVPVEFLTVYRDEEYIRRSTKEMSPEDKKRFALEYYGWDYDEYDDCQSDTLIKNLSDFTISESDDDLPF